MEEFVHVPKDLKGYVIGAKGSIIKSIRESSGAGVYSLSRDEEGFRVSGTRDERELAKKLILEKVEGGKQKVKQNKSNKICYFIDDFNLPVNTMLRLEKDYGPPPLEYRLRPFHSYGTEESPSLANDPIYFKTLEAEVLRSLERIKHEIEAKRPLKADIWCHFGTVLIRQPDEGSDGEWSTEDALRKLLEGTEWRTLFRGGVNLDEKFVERHWCNQSPPEYEDFQSRYHLTFRTPKGDQLIFKVWVIKKNVGKTLESIVIPFTDLKNILDEVYFDDQFTRSRCRGWLILPPQRYLRADILFPGCEFDCRLTIRALADSGFHMDFVPKDDIRNTLLRYLSKVTFSDEDDIGLRLPDEKLPDGFQLPFMRCSKRAVYRFSGDFSIIISKESTGVYGRDIKKGTDLYLHCKEWDELLNSENWEPEDISKKLPDFFRFVKKVQSSIIHEMKYEGATVTYCMKQKEEIADFVDVAQDLKRYVIGTGGSILRSIHEKSGARVISLSRAEEGFWVKGTKAQRECAKNLILEMVEGGKGMREQKIYYIDDFNLPANTNLRLEKEDGAQAKYRLRPIRSNEIEKSLSPRNDPIYFKDLEVEVLRSLKRIKREMETKHHLKADMWCHFGTVLIRQPDEGTGGEWSIEEAIDKLFQGTKWKTTFKTVINFDEKFLEEHLGKQLHPEYDDYILSRYDSVFETPKGGQLRFKAWVTKENVGEKLEGIPSPYTEVKNILDEVDFRDPFTSSRCRGWLVLRPKQYLRANILFPGCKFDCRLNIRVLADNARDMDLVPKEDTRNALLSYLSQVTFSDEDDFGLRLPDEKFLPDGFQLSFMRCSKRAEYRFSEDFSIILSKESTASGSGVKKETDFHLHCKKWDALLDSGNWEPAEITKKLPDFFRFVKKVQSSIIHEIKREGASVPPEILARGSSAVKSYFKALADGRTSLKRVPIMLIGQDRAGKTSLKKSLKGLCFDPEEDSTVGINVDPSYFKVTTDAFRTGTAAEQQDAEGDISLDHHAVMKTVHDLRKGNESLLSITSTEDTKTPSDDECERARIKDTIQPERHTEHSETREQAPTQTKDAIDVSPFPSGDNQEARTNFTRTLPEETVVEIETLLKGDNREHLFLTLWDFAGQSVYYDTHPIFLTERAIYCLAYDLSLNPRDMAKPVVKQGVYRIFQETANLKTNLDYLDFWMWSVASLAGDASKSADETAAKDEMSRQKLPPVFLVCTHADTPYDKKHDPTDIAREIFGCLKSKPYGIHLSDFFVVDNTKSGTESECPEVESLREEVYDVAKGLPHVSETIPIKWLEFEKALRELKEEGKHFVNLKRAKDIAKSCDIVDDVGFETVMNYLHDLRILIHFDDTPALNELVVLDMQWLIDVFKNVITVKRYNRKEKEFVDLWSKLEKEGVLHEELLSHVWRTLSEREGLYEGLITIMEKFSLLCLLSSENPKSYLVPSMLKTHPSSEIVEVVSSAQIPSLLVKFKSGKVPAGLFHRFVVQFFRWGKGTFLRPAELQLFQNVVRFITSGDKICSVIFVCHTSTVEVAIYAEDQQKATACACASVVCWQLGLMLESMRKEFFWLRNMRYEKAVLCPVCCPGGSLVHYWDSPDFEGCKEEHGLHFWSLSELCSAKKPIVCTKPGLKKDVVVDIEQFSPWLPPSEQQKANGEPLVKSLSTGEGVLPTKTTNKAPLWTKKISVSSVITSQGGTVVGEGVKLVCAPGVVERPVTVTVTLEDPSKYCGLLVQNDLENDIMFCAPIINLQPNGHHFKRGVELTVRLKGAISSFNEVVILHGKETCLRKIAWEDITQNAVQSNETSDEVIITTERFSIIAAFIKRTLILTKDIASRLNLLRYNYSLLVLFNNKSVPNQLAVVFVSEDVENEAFFQEDKTSVLVQLKEEGFREIFVKGQDDRRIYNHEELKVSTSLGDDFKCSSSDLTVVVESSTWWSTGHAIKLPLESTKQDKILYGRITVKGEYGNSKEMTFCELDIHGYVRDLLGVKGDIFNVIPIAEALKLPKEALHEIKEKWRDDECQLEVILEQSDVSSLKEVLEGVKSDYRLTTKRGQMHVKHLRYFATKIGSLEHDSVEFEKYFASKIHAYCQMMLRDCCLEMESTADGVGKAASSTKLDAFITIRMQGSIPDCLKDFLFFACKDICSSSEECIIEKFKSVVPELIQMIKEVFLENDTNHEEQNGLRGLSDEALAPFELSIRIAQQDKTVLELLSVVAKILEKLCQQNCSHERVSEVEKWGKSAANLAMLDFLKPFFQNCPKNMRLHKRLELFSERMVDILSNPREFADEVFIRNFANIALSLIDFAKFDASKLVRFVLIDSSNSCINCSREHTQYNLNRNPSVFSQTVHVKKESEDELTLHASASVHMGGDIHKVGAFQSVILLCESGWESLEKCRRKMPRVTTAKTKDKDSDNLRVVLCSSQEQELSEMLQVLGSEMSEGLVDLTKSQVTQCPLTARNISARAGKVLSLCLIYKWGSGSLDLESKDFMVCANSSARSASFSELPLFGFSTAAQLELDEAAATQGNPFPLASADVNLNFPISQPFSQRPLNIQCRKVGNEDKALTLPDKLQESLASLSCDPQQIVSLFKENQSLMEASLEQTGYQSMKLIRCFSREANIAKRLDVVKHLRSISLAGTVGPLLSENLDVREMPIRQGRQLTIALSGGDEWKLVAEKLGLNPREIRYLDKRVLNPAEAMLACVAEKRGLTVGELYDVLSDCGLPLFADEL